MASDTRRLERVQERGLCAVFKDKQSSYQQLLAKAKLPTLYNRRLQDICILMYKVKHNLYPRTICDMFLTNSHTYNLRQKDFYQSSFNTVTHGKHSIRYLGPRLWSKISSKDIDRLPVLRSSRPGYKVLIRVASWMDVVAATFAIHNFKFLNRIINFSLNYFFISFSCFFRLYFR